MTVDAQRDEVAGAQRQVGIERELLGHVADQRVAPAARRAADQHRAADRRRRAQDDPEQRRLAGAVGADQAGELARRAIEKSTSSSTWPAAETRADARDREDLLRRGLRRCAGDRSSATASRSRSCR